MNGEWSLNALYSGYEDPAYLADEQKADVLGEQINALADTLEERNERENLLAALPLLEQEADLYDKLFNFSALRQEANTADEKSASRLGSLSQKNSRTTKAKTRIFSYIARIPESEMEALIAQEPLLQEYRYYLQCIQEDDRYLLNGDVEEALAKYGMSGGDAWADLQAYLTSSVKADYQGKPLTLSAVRNLAYDADPEVRKQAYEAELACYEKIKDAVAFSLNSIKMQAISECELRGFASPLEKTLHESRMRRETLDALLEAMQEYMPKFWEYLRAKGRALGHADGLPWYDLFAPMGSNGKKYTVEEAEAYLLQVFGAFNPKMAEIMHKAFREEWIDFFPREGKVGGAFCAGIPAIRQFRILTNFDGSFNSITTLGHELGHGYHDFMVQENRPLNRSYSMPVAETASTFNENVILEEALEKAEDKEEQLALAEGELMEVTQIICDIYSRFLFEQEVCARRKDEFLFADQLCELMLKAQRQAYGNGIAADTLHPYMWVCKSHYYGPDLAFYNFPYAFGGLFARGLYAKYRAEGKNFLPKYDAMLRATPTASVEEAAAICGVDVTDKQFWLSSLQSYTPTIELFKQLTGQC